MDLQLNNKITLVTGGSKGLGFGTAQRLASEGCKVVISSRNEVNLVAAAAKIKEITGQTVLTFPADVSKKEDITQLMEFVKSKCGGLDILVSNSGGPKPGKFDSFSDEMWYAAIENTLMSTIRLFREGLAIMREQRRGGRLLVITTTGAKQPQDNLLLSNTLRAGIHALVKTLSREIAATGITVNAVVPGKFMTDRQMSAVKALANRENCSFEEAIEKRLAQVPLNRMGQPNELGSYIAYLCSLHADYITGTAMNIDGGYMASI